MAQLDTEAFHQFFKKVIAPSLQKEEASIEKLKSGR